MKEIERKTFAALTFPLFLISLPFVGIGALLDKAGVPFLPYLFYPFGVLMMPYIFFSEDTGP